jgi:hypothetical protein
VIIALSALIVCAVVYLAVFSAVLYLMRDRDRHPLLTVDMAVDLVHDAIDLAFVRGADMIAGPHELVSRRKAKQLTRKGA